MTAPTAGRTAPAPQRAGASVALRAEILRLATSIPLRWGALATVGFISFLAALYGHFSREVVATATTEAGLGNEAVLLNVYTTGYNTGFVAAMLFGLWLLAGEQRRGMLSATLLATPRRGRVVVAKLVVATVGSLLLGLLLMGSSVAIGAAFASARGAPTLLGDPDVLALLARCVLAFVPWALIGLGIGAIIGRYIVAVVVGLVWVLLVEVVLAGLLGSGSATATGASYLPRSLSGAVSGQVLGAGIDALAPVTALVVLLVYAGALVAVGTAAVLRRDVRA